MRCVIWAPSPLYLKNAVLDGEGSVKSGWVINGAWNYELRKGECLSKASSQIITRWKAPEHIPCVMVPANNRDDYNQVIEWASKELDKLRDAPKNPLVTAPDTN